LISAIHEKDELLDSQEDFLIKENKKHVKTKNAYAMEVEKCEKLSSELSTLNASLASLRNENEKLIAKARELDVCNVSISNLRDENDILHAKIVKLNSCKPSTSTIEDVTICTRCRDVNTDAIHDHIAMIKQQNDHRAN
jgi:chromosome segregation ATPase